MTTAAAASGFAVVTREGRIIVESIGPTERSAMVNWLLASAKVFVSHAWSDAAIAEAFREIGRGTVAVRSVEIVALWHADT